MQTIEKRTNEKVYDLIESNLSYKEKAWLNVAWIAGVVGLIVMGVSTYLFLKHQQIDFTKTINSSKFSDYGSFISGAVVSFWTFASVILFYLAFKSQQKELHLQREELAQTRCELRGQREELEKTNRAHRKQQFENRFFELLNLQLKIKENSFVENHLNTDLFNMQNKKGVDFYNALATRIARLYYKERQAPFDPLHGLDRLRSIYEMAFNEFNYILGHYYRNLYHIVRLIHESEFEEERKNYIRYLRAQLSQSELILLAYNGISKKGIKFKQLIEDYHLLKNIDFDTKWAFNERIMVDPLLFEHEYPHLVKEYRETLS